MNRIARILASEFMPQIPRIALTALCFIMVPSACPAQTHNNPQPTEPPATSTPTQPDDSQPALPPGKILFSRDASSQSGASQASDQQSAQPDPISDADRSATTFTGYDLDVHLDPANGGISVRAALTLRNDSPAPLARLPLQLSSTLHWEAISAAGSRLPIATYLLDTDADHTGQMTEAVITLPAPLSPGASTTLTTLYSGTIPVSATRLERIGAPPVQASAEDWDSISSGFTGLRGFGNVLWYPVSAPPVFLGDGAKLFQSVGAMRLRESTATIRLRLAVEFTSDPPDAAYFCGRRETLTAVRDNPNLPVADSPGVATATFAPQPLGYRTPNLFLADDPSQSTGTSEDPTLIAALTTNDDALPSFKAAADQVAPLLTDWFGARPQTPLTILGHPGQPFEDDAFLVYPMRAADPDTLAPALVHSLTHAWIHSSQPWIDEGLPQFLSLLWLERTKGREAALAQLEDAAPSLALAEPELPADAAGLAPNSTNTPPPSSSSSSSDEAGGPAPSVSPAGANLLAPTSEVFYRTKAAAVWWMLRSIVGDDALKQTLQTYRADPRLDRDPHAFERTLAELSHKDLHWFFNDWVYRDLGLPDLTLVNVTPSQLESRAGQPSGWLVAVDVRNDGYAEAEVPVTVRSPAATATQRLRIPGRASASIRIVFPGTPTQVEVNDGGVPETRTSIHTRDLVLSGH